MKIMLVNKFHYLKGGSEKYYFDLGKLLKENGHQVAYFSMKDEKNINTGDKEFFVNPIDLNNGSKMKAFDVIYSKDNYKKMIEAIEDFKPDIIHLNNFQRQLSSSIVKAINEKKIPIVYTAHDVQAICPAITMIDNEMNICEKCMNGKYFNCIKKKCNKGSTLKSIIGAIEGNYYRRKKIYTNKINKIITPSEFYKNKLIKDGIDTNKVIAVHNFINIEEYNMETTNQNYGLYIGRLSREKGIMNLVKAFKKNQKGILYIAGDGPEKDNISRFIKKEKLDNKIKLLGFLNKEQVIEKIRNCSFVVIPSIWYENCPYSILETLAIGKPIIGSKIGGIPELVQENVTGLLYDFNNIEELSNCMNKLFDDKELCDYMGKNAKEYAKLKFSKEQYYNKIIELYSNIKGGY